MAFSPNCVVTSSFSEMVRVRSSVLVNLIQLKRRHQLCRTVINEVALHFQLSKIGQIASADIEIKNLTLFIGKNGSGKTYATSSIWSLINFVKDTAPYADVISAPQFKKWKGELSEIAEKGGVSQFSFSKSDQEDSETAVLELFHRNRKAILAEAIGYDGFGASRVKFSRESRIEEISVLCRVEKVTHSIEIDDDHELAGGIDNDEAVSYYSEDSYSVLIEFSVNDKKFNSYFSENVPEEVISDIVEDQVATFIIGFSCFGREWSDFENTVYIPAARTGIMLALDYYVQGAIGRGTSGFLSPDGSKKKYLSENLPAPIQKFATSMTRSSFFSLLKQPVELTNILGGKIGRGKVRGTFSFQPNNSGISIPLASSSSLVTELSALSIVSRNMRRGMFLIFEEPEAHLHLEAQREMAKYIAILVNNGVKVLITTHSDTFLQQLNNLIVLSSHPKRDILLEDLSIQKNELIMRDDVVGYDFVHKEGSTDVSPLPLTRTGFVAESLNETLERLYLETVRINDGLDEED